ncbi:Hint domain-containing protein [Shimia sagamensis]|uniref:Hint domain-containing protein n=1 Tax=Shimia sagamensis TaxID=1566352 RepID=A0ABY1PID0_9RHOB|nr:Hint domain-containing protein [Shimia sagamensis]SMP35092.1 Hint domain-containing protein [Shimia sagamensis]
MSRKQNPIIERFDRYLASIGHLSDPNDSQKSASTRQTMQKASSTDKGVAHVLGERGPNKVKEGQLANSGSCLDLNVLNSSLGEDENLSSCFTSGTQILTPIGELPIEDLEVGDSVITRDNGTIDICWIGRKNLTAEDLELNPHLYPILIEESSLANYLPDRDTWVSPQHRILFSCADAPLLFEEPEVLVEARHLTQLKGVRRAACDQVTYIYLMFERHELVLSNGLWSESLQPCLQSLGCMDDHQRTEVLELFPDLAADPSLSKYSSNYRSLNKFETDLLLTQGTSLL